MKKIIIITIIFSLFFSCKKSEQVPINDMYYNAGIQYLSPPVKAPDFTLENIEGIKKSLSDYRGKVVVLNFWAHWCGPCVQEMPSINSLYNKTRDMDVEVVTVNLGESLDIVKSYIDENSFGFDVLLDSNKMVSQIFGIRSIPSTYIIDRDGNIVGGKLGAHEWDSPMIIDILKGLAKQWK